jgi:hypothetical protein
MNEWTDGLDREMDGSMVERMDRPFQTWPLGSVEENCGEMWRKVAGQWLHLHCGKAEW